MKTVKSYIPASPIMQMTVLTMISIIAMLTQYACLSTSTQRQAEKLAHEKNYQAAIDAYQVVTNTKAGTPEAYRAQLGLARLYINKIDQPQLGVKVYRDLIAAAPDSGEAAEAHYRLGTYHFRIKDYESAQQSFDAIVNKFPSLGNLSHNAQLMLAKSYEEAGAYKKAIATYDNVVNRHPESDRAAQALTNKAKIQKEYLKDRIAAEQTYQSLIEQYNNVEGAEETIDDARRELQSMGARIPELEIDPGTAYDRAQERRMRRRERDRPRGGAELSPAMGYDAYGDSGFGVTPEEVIREFGNPWEGGGHGRSGQNDDETQTMIKVVADINFLIQNYRNAGTLYFHAIEVAKENRKKIDPYDYIRLSVCYRKVGMHQRAVETLKEGASKNIKVLEAVIISSANQYEDGDYQRVLEALQPVAGLNRTRDPEIYWRLGLAYKQMGSLYKAVESFERSIASDTDYTDSIQSLAEMLNYQLKERERAIIFQDIIDTKGHTSIGEKELGDICYKYGNYLRAKSKYEAAVRIAQREKENSDITPSERHNLDNQILYAKIHAAMADYQNGGSVQAQERIDALAAEHPNHPLIAYGHGQMALLKGDVETAIATFETTIEKDPASDAAPIALGEYYLSKENPDAAIGVWEGVLKTYPQNHGVRRRLNALKQQREAQATEAEANSDQSGQTAALTTKKRQSFLPAKRRTIYPRNRIPKSQLPSALFVGLNEDQVIEKYGEPVEILDPPPNILNATKRFAYGALVPGMSSTFSLEGSEFIFDENGVLGYHKVYFGDVNALVGGGSEYPALVSELPDELKSTLCDVINEQVFEAKKYNLIVQKAQVVWELNNERWWATVHATFPARDFTSDKSIKNYKPKLKDYHIMELLVTNRNLSPDLFLTKPKGIAYENY
jgi:tetratricopeptide (TPR) repeat protein